MKFDELCLDAQMYIDRFIRGKPITREEALKHNLILEVCRSYENGELDKKSNFDVRKENIVWQ